MPGKEEVKPFSSGSFSDDWISALWYGSVGAEECGIWNMEYPIGHKQ